MQQRFAVLVGRIGLLAVASQASAARESGSSAGCQRWQKTTRAPRGCATRALLGHAPVPAIGAALAGTALT